jgi:hydroxyethylthiazole kinase-like uncharacterized protein yjeF
MEVTREKLKTLLPPLVKDRHKYQAGYVLGYAGSSRFPGSAKLAGLGALRAGAGIVRIYSPQGIGEVPYELIALLWNKKEWEQELKRAHAVFIGPGLGSCKRLPRIDLPCVLDADALQAHFEFPKKAILTPHRGEALRLLQLDIAPPDEDLFSLCKNFSAKRDVILLLKGSPTRIFQGKKMALVPFGDPGMATAGSGDVLTGIIASFLAQGLDPFDAAMLGASIHGMAGEAAARERGSRGMIASDLLDFLPQAFSRCI